MSEILDDSQLSYWNPQCFQFKPPDSQDFLDTIFYPKNPNIITGVLPHLQTIPRPPPPACLFKVAFPPLIKAVKQILQQKGQFGKAAEQILTQFLCKDKVSNLLQFIFGLLYVNKKIQGFLNDFYERIQQILNQQQKLKKKLLLQKKILLQKIINIIKQKSQKKGRIDPNWNIVKELWSLAKRDRKGKKLKNTPSEEKRKRITKDIGYRNIKTRSSRGPQQDFQRFNQRKKDGEKLRKEINRRQKFDEIDAEQIKENVKITFARISHLSTTE